MSRAIASYMHSTIHASAIMWLNRVNICVEMLNFNYALFGASWGSAPPPGSGSCPCPTPETVPMQ